MMNFDFETFNENTGYHYAAEGDSNTPDVQDLIWMIQDRVQRLDTGSDDADILREFVMALSPAEPGTYFRPGDCLIAG